MLSSWPSAADAAMDIISHWRGGHPQTHTSYSVCCVSHSQSSSILSPTSEVQQQVATIDDAMQFDAIAAAFQEVAKQRDILRTTFLRTPDGIVQVLREEETPRLGQGMSVVVSSIDQFLQIDRTRGFKLGDEYFSRLTVVITPQEKRRLVFTTHTALCDSESASWILADLLHATRGEPLIDRPSYQQVIDCILCQNDESSKAFWQTYMADLKAEALPSMAAFHFDSATSDVRAFPLAMHLSVSAADLVEQAQLIGTTAEVLAKLAWATTIRKYSRANDALFYQRVSNRVLPIPNASRALGPFTSTVPCRIQFDESFDIREMIRTVHDQHISLASHAHSIGTAF
ncbi:hypothetical protein AeMF1_003203, partial [Aphanomyces euteiches]